MKRLVVLLLLSVSFSGLLFAGKLFSLGVGTINQLQLDLTSDEVLQASVIDVHNWATGTELRAKILGANLDAYMLIQQGEIIDVSETGKAVFKDDIAQRLFGMVAVGFSSKSSVASTFSFGVGSLLGFNVTDTFDIDFWAGSESNILGQKDLEDFLSDIRLAYRLRLDIHISKLSFGLNYQVPSTGFSYSEPEFSLLAPIWSEGRIGASMVMTL
ncbi:MAG: hypothetical protein ACOXZ4_02325 [Sphaerochaetaceae bacterium]